ncbi:MAG: ADP-ribosylation factor-like protein, partial [Promethearchaeota archaeon]
DGIIFVADSRAQCLQHNIRSWNELKTMFREDFHNLPLVISLNKSDFKETREIFDHEFLKGINLNLFKHLSVNKTVAIEGKGILDSFNRVITFIFPQLTLKMSITN